ncbi:MAG: hypothetical protein KIT14_17980 [bacterium]|nr:hypothetical protein [bacterium]
MAETTDRPPEARMDAPRMRRSPRRRVLLTALALVCAAPLARAEPACDDSSAAFDRLLARKSHDHPTPQGRGAVHWSKIKWTGKQWALAEVAVPTGGRHLCIHAGNADVADTLSGLDRALPDAGMTRDDFQGNVAFVCHVEVAGLRESKHEGCARDVLVEVMDACEVSARAEPCPRLEDYDDLSAEQTARYKTLSAPSAR